MNEKAGTTILSKEISLLDFWRVFRERVWILLVVAALAVDIVAGWQLLTVSPKYESTAVLYILKQGDEQESSSTTAQDFNLALNVVNDCTFLLKSHAVVDEVLELVDTQYNYEELSDSISTNNPNNTRILEVSVVANTPQEAKQIVDTLCKIGADQITDAMGFKQVNLYEYGTLDEVPCNTMGISRILLAGFAAAAVAYAFFVVLYILDDSLRTDEDIEKLLELTILGKIPSASAVSRKRGRKGVYAYGAYGAGGKK